jgi:hypothetical protein
LRGSSETCSLAASLSLAAGLIEGHVNVATTHGVHWGAKLVLTATHFPDWELELELELHGSGRNVDLT